MARISLTPRRTPLVRLALWYSRRAYGREMEPLLAAAHHRRLLRTLARYELGVARWKALDPALKHLAVAGTAASIGCSWCMDFGHWEADRLGLPMEKVSRIPAWREHRDSFDETELLVLEYAEQMTANPPEVTDEVAATLLRELGEAAFVELTTMIALENQRSRINSALGLVSQGFATECAVQPRRAASAK
ncbi:carboxymuconolactone decarboxylase family protein [Streptomyces otsuchiensis]|uniref:carboxymuconolactone decarboxylase family protein n=1 Tax=Streptomyces otsuchiensis TaxID=2681388 RepID=UPI00103246D1|nr:carboxymuconolactone decarboxylase family protein [Streptomyces otsuchiensis]